MTLRYKKPWVTITREFGPNEHKKNWYKQYYVPYQNAYRVAHENVWLPLAFECFGGVWRCESF